MLNCDSHHLPCSNLIFHVHQPAVFSELAGLHVLSHKTMGKEVITNYLTIYQDFLSFCWFKLLNIQSQSVTLH